MLVFGELYGYLAYVPGATVLVLQLLGAYADVLHHQVRNKLVPHNLSHVNRLADGPPPGHDGHLVVLCLEGCHHGKAVGHYRFPAYVYHVTLFHLVHLYVVYWLGNPEFIHTSIKLLGIRQTGRNSILQINSISRLH